MIHADNADLLDCRMVIEGANSPTTRRRTREDEREVNDRLGTIIRRAYREVMARARSHDDPALRVAAYQVGIERVVEAARLRGYI
ncbi:MAG: hypothetical protein ACJ76K_03935 [Solirubrobacteraceae bacterium]|jgi:glutamate dehydrogenase/leucine dehydrogenase